MSNLTFYTSPMSRGRIVRWMLEETGAPYTTELLDYATIKNPSYLAINPMGKVPAIKHGDTVVTECAAICAYLADAFPAASLAPPVNARGAYYRWLFFAAGPLEAAITNKTLGVTVPPERERMLGYGNFSMVMDTLEQAVSQSPYITGDQFTAADLYVGAQIAFGLLFGTIENRPAFKNFCDRLNERPANRRAAAIDDALLPAAT